MLDGLGAEGGEQRLVDGADAPSAEDGDQQLRGARQHARDAIAGAHAALLEVIGEARSGFLELGESPGGALTVAALPIQGDALRVGVAVAAFDAGVEGVEVADQARGSGVGVVELAGSGEVVAHRVGSGFVFVGVPGWSRRAGMAAMSKGINLGERI
ncbi:hypothetical protein D9M68_652010 [compost metagenome]